MTWVGLLLLAVGVGVDAMTAAVAVGVGLPDKSRKTVVLTASWFALSHAVMPLIGWLTVGTVADALEKVSGWAIFVLLLALGVCRIRDALSGVRETATHGHVLLTAAVTGLDAMSVGVTMALSPPTGVLAYPTGGWLGCGVTAAVTFAMCLIGTALGSRMGERFGRPALLTGGVLLVLLSIRALFM